MKKLAIAVSLTLAATAFEAVSQVKSEDQIKQRRSAMAVIGYNFASLGAMAQDKKPYNKEEATRNAELVAALAEYPHGFFGDGTDKGADTKAKPEIWQKRADFDAKMDKMEGEARKLPAAARADLAALKAQVGETGKACKACHDDFRAK